MQKHPKACEVLLGLCKTVMTATSPQLLTPFQQGVSKEFSIKKGVKSFPWLDLYAAGMKDIILSLLTVLNLVYFLVHFKAQTQGKAAHLCVCFACLLLFVL